MKKIADFKSQAKKIKLIALDLDGTLLKNHTEITDVTIQTCRKALKQGFNIVLITGRGPMITIPYAELILGDKKGFKGEMFVACFNGSFILNVTKNKMIRKSFISKSIVDEIFTYHQATKLNLRFGAYNESEDNKIVLKISKDSLIGRHFAKKTKLSYIVAGKDMESYNEAFKINILGIPHRLTRFLADMPKKTTDKFDFARVQPWAVEINAKNTNKYTGCMIICKELGISIDNVIAFGDSMNDYPLFEKVGIAVAMKNADNVLKSISSFVSEKTNVKDGVANTINKLLIK